MIIHLVLNLLKLKSNILKSVSLKWMFGFSVPLHLFSAVIVSAGATGKTTVTSFDVYYEGQALAVIIVPVTISEIRVQNMEMNVDFYFYILENSGEILASGTQSREGKNLTSSFFEFRNCRKCDGMSNNSAVEAPAQFESLDFNAIGRSLVILREYRQFYCVFDLSNYPLDIQRCFIKIQTNCPNITMVPHPNVPSDMKTLLDPSLPDFDITESRPDGNCFTSPIHRDSECVQYVLVFQRKLAYHLLNFYCPSMLVVMVSWVAFWIDVDMVSPRVALGLTPLLTLSTQFANSQRSLPPVSYAKASDIWMFACMCLVFGCLIEFPIAIHAKRNCYPKKTAPIYRVREFKMTKTYLYKPGPSPSFEHPQRVNKVDKVCRLAFPLVFLIFNLIYWGYYSSVKQGTKLKYSS